MLETSPRMGQQYRDVMAERVRYTASDYDESAHRAVIRLDLQRIDLPDQSLDVVLTPHVLEHVPDTDQALAELFRVMRPGGTVFLQVPLAAARTSVPRSPEYHGDRTLVYFRFGWDLADMIRRQGFACDILCPADLRAAIQDGRSFGYQGDDCDSDDLMGGIDAAALTVVVDNRAALRHAFVPAFQFVTFECRKPRG